MCWRKHCIPGDRVSVNCARPATGVASARRDKNTPASQPSPNLDDAGSIVHPVTASCDRAWTQTRISSDTASTVMQCLRPLCQSGGPDKHLLMTRISWRQPLCVAVVHPKNIHAFCGQWLLCPSPSAPNHLSLTWLSISWSGLSHRLQVKTDTIRDATEHVLIQFRGAYWRYWKNGPHLLFFSQQDE